MMLLLAALIAVMGSLILVLARAIAGPSLFDRLLMVNSFGTHTVVLISLIAFVMEAPYFIDIALIYALINFSSTLAVLKFVKARSFADEEVL